MTETAYHRIRPRPKTAPSGCPVDTTFSPFTDDYLRDPYPALRQRLADSPVFYAEELGYLVLTRMEDVAEVFRRKEDFSSENVQDPVLPICEAAREALNVPDYRPIAVMSNRAQPDHTRIRKHTQAGFSARRMKILEPYLRRRCEEMVDAMLASGAPAEFVQAIGHPLPGEMIFRLIGFPQADDARLKSWTTNRLAFTWGRTEDDEQVDIARNMLTYWRYCADFVRQRAEIPADDFTSELLAAHKADPEDLSYPEVESVIYGLSFAGHEIVSNMLANSLISLLTHRSEWRKICDDPAKIPNAVEEILRFNSPQTSWRRVAVRDTEIAGYKIPEGTQVFLSLAAANHDHALFEEPAILDIERSNARGHIAFGRGIHFCLGSRLATLEGIVLLETLVSKVPDLELVPDQQLTYFPNFTFRGPAELHLTW